MRKALLLLSLLAILSAGCSADPPDPARVREQRGRSQAVAPQGVSGLGGSGGVQGTYDRPGFIPVSPTGQEPRQTPADAPKEQPKQ